MFLENPGDGMFFDATAARMPLWPAYQQQIEADDLDSDGDLDVIVVDNMGVEQVLLNDGNGVFSLSSPLFPASYQRVFFGQPATVTKRLVLADVDRDGDADALEYVGGGLRVFANRARALRAPYLMGLGRPWQIEVTGDPGAAGGSILAALCASTTALSPAARIGSLGWLSLGPATLSCSMPVATTGTVVWSFTVPNTAALVGADFFWQALVAPAATPSAARFTNPLRTAVTRY